MDPAVAGYRAAGQRRLQTWVRWEWGSCMLSWAESGSKRYGTRHASMRKVVAMSDPGSGDGRAVGPRARDERRGGPTGTAPW